MTILLAFIVLINPFSALTLFLDLTKGYSVKSRQKVARVSSISVVIIIIFFTVAGNSLLQMLGISLGAFQVAGGILVFLIGLNMMNGGGNPVKPNEEDVDVEYIQEVVPSTASAVIPLAFPMMIGPGGISTVVIYAAQNTQTTQQAFIILVGCIIGLICYLSLLASHKISHFLGEEGLNIVNRIMGMMLTAIAVEIFFSGLKQFIPSILG